MSSINKERLYKAIKAGGSIRLPDGSGSVTTREQLDKAIEEGAFNITTEASSSAMPVGSKGIPGLFTEIQKLQAQLSSDSGSADKGAAEFLRDLEANLAPISQSLGLAPDTHPVDLVNHLQDKVVEANKIGTDKSAALDTAGTERAKLESQITDLLKVRDELTKERDALKAQVKELSKAKPAAAGAIAEPNPADKTTAPK